MSTAQPGPQVILDRERALSRAADLCSFIDASPMPHHAASESAAALRAAGFEELREEDAWRLAAGAGYFVIRGGTTVIAFRLGAAAPSSTGVAAVGAHLDSPNLRIKPIAETGAQGYRQLGVEVYGGPLLATWTDRDLGIAGRVILRDGAQRLVAIRRPVARVANLAIHLNRAVNEEGMTLDRQRHLPPLVGIADGPVDDWTLRGELAAELAVSADEIAAHDLGLFDVTPSATGGFGGELLFAPRLDNLASSHAALVALTEGAGSSGEPPSRTCLISLYDHEECGSRSNQGAAGRFLLEVLERIAAGHPDAAGPPHEELARTLARSLLVSADMAHAVHPNYVEMHEPSHRPLLNRGPVIKRHDSQRYATDGETSAAFAALCRDAGFEAQVFVNRSDLPGGSTIGPIAAAGVGMRTVDVGNPMLSMHSVREMAGTWDHDLMIEAFLRHFR